MPKSGFIFLFTLILLVSATSIQGQSGGLQFLIVGPDAVSLSLSEAVTARRLHGSAMFANPATPGFETRSALNAAHTFWLGNSGNSHASFVLPSGSSVWSFGILNSTISEIEARQTPGPSDGNFSVSYFALSGGYARKIGPVAAGISLTYLNEQLFALQASGYSVNFGLNSTWKDDRVRIGTSVVNLGRMEPLAETRSALPTQWRSGIWTRLIQFSTSGSSEIPIIIDSMIDVHIPIDNDSMMASDDEIRISTGLEITISDLIILRAGLRSGETARPFSTGLGLNIGNARFNYAFVPFDSGFGLTHALSLTYFLD